MGFLTEYHGTNRILNSWVNNFWLDWNTFMNNEISSQLELYCFGIILHSFLFGFEPHHWLLNIAAWHPQAVGLRRFQCPNIFRWSDSGVFCVPFGPRLGLAKNHHKKVIDVVCDMWYPIHAAWGACQPAGGWGAPSPFAQGGSSHDGCPLPWSALEDGAKKMGCPNWDLKNGVKLPDSPVRRSEAKHEVPYFETKPYSSLRSLNEIQKSETQLDTEHMAVDQSWEDTKSGSQRCEAKSDRRNPVSYNRLILQSHALRLHFKFLGLHRQGQGWHGMTEVCKYLCITLIYDIYTPRPVPPRALSYHQLFRVSLGAV